MIESTPTPQTAVVIDDDPDVRALLVTILSGAGFTVHAADNGLDGVAAVFEHRPLLTTLDVNMPGIDGYETARRIRERSDTYIVVITALTDEADAVLGFSVGADDVVTKPFRPRELRARLLAAQRRQQAWTVEADPAGAESAGPNGTSTGGAPVPTSAATSPPPPATAAPTLTVPPAAGPTSRAIGWNGLRLERATHAIAVDGMPVSLTPTEFDLLATLLEAAPEVRSKSDLVRSLHDDPSHPVRVSESDERSIETHVTNLRRKLGDSATQPRFVETVRGVGYRAVTPAAPDRAAAPTER